MAYSPIADVLGGQLSATQIENIIVPLNGLLVGTGQIITKAATADFQAPASAGAIAGASATISVKGNNSVAVVLGISCIGISVADVSGKILAAGLTVDGVAQSGEAIGNAAVVVNFETHPQVWVVPMFAGSHTFQLTGRTDGTSAASRVFRATHTTLTVVLFDVQ